MIRTAHNVPARDDEGEATSPDPQSETGHGERKEVSFRAGGFRFVVRTESRKFREDFERLLLSLEPEEKEESVVEFEMKQSFARGKGQQWVLKHQGKDLIKRKQPSSVILGLEAIFRRHICLKQGGELVLHSGAVVGEKGAVLLAGHSGVGKSTLAARCVQEGFGYLSEELGILDPVTGTVSAYPKFFTLSRDSVRILFGETGLKRLEQEVPFITSDGRLDISPDFIRAGSLCPQARLRAVVFPWRTSRNDVTRLPKGEGLRRISQHVLSDGPLMKGELEALIDLLQEIPCYQLSFSDLDFALKSLSEV